MEIPHRGDKDTGLIAVAVASALCCPLVGARPQVLVNLELQRVLGDELEHGPKGVFPS